MRAGRRTLWRAVGVAAGCAAMWPAGVVAEPTPAADFDLSLSSRVPATRTAADLHILYKAPSDPDAKPGKLTRVEISLPEGGRYDGGAVPACEATDEMLMLMGRDACPADSNVGGGTVTTLTGAGPPVDPLVLDATFLNTGDGLILLFSAKDTNLTMLVVRGTFTAPGTLTFASIPPVPGGPPDFSTVLREVDVRLDEHGSDSEPFVRTPERCPSAGVWTSRLVFSTHDYEGYTAQSTTPCARSNAEMGLPGLVGRTLRVDRRGRVTLRLQATLDRQRVRVALRRRSRTLAAGRASTQDGRATRVRLRLDDRTRTRLQRTERLRVTAVIASGRRSRWARVTLLAPPGLSRHRH